MHARIFLEGGPVGHRQAVIAVQVGNLAQCQRRTGGQCHLLIGHALNFAACPHRRSLGLDLAVIRGGHGFDHSMNVHMHGLDSKLASQCIAGHVHVVEGRGQSADHPDSCPLQPFPGRQCPKAAR